ncbi:MAG: hypothetical protein ACI4J3_00065 [Oscillospiraceae bacterium]
MDNMNGKKKAFVIMPYAKNFNRLYSIIIQGALEKMGYECVRQDMTGQGGHIMHNVIRNITEANISIVDISDLNWNVAYELGIRHTMHKNGTIIMCRKDQQDSEPFDIQGVNILYYDPNWMETFSEDQIISELVKRIEFAENSSVTSSDSPVHDVYTALPETMLHWLDAERGDHMREQLQGLQEENEQLKKRLENAGLSEESDAKSVDIRTAIAQAIAISVYCGDAAVQKLRELQTAGKKQEFASFLADVLEEGYLDEYDCKVVYDQCRRIGIASLTKVFLEQAAKLHPDSEELNIYLANELCNSYKDREQAFIIANEMVGITKQDGVYRIGKHVSFNVVKSYIDVLTKLKKYKELVAVAEVMLQEYRKREFQALIYRTLSMAHMKLDQAEQAIAAANAAIEIMPDHSLGYYRLYQAQRADEQLANAYLSLERCISLTPNDEDYYYIIAGFICDEYIARTAIDAPVQSITARDIRTYAVPFIVFVLNMNPKAHARAVDFLNRNGFGDDAKRCIRVLTEQRDLFAEFADLDFSFVTYCVENQE